MRSIHSTVLHSVLALAVALLPRLSAGQSARATATARALTAQDSAWIAAHPVIRVGLDVAFPPYAMTDPSGAAVGIDPDFLDLISRRTGLKFEIVHGGSWTQIQDDFRAGRIDMLMNISRSAEREAYMSFTGAYNKAPIAIVTRSETPYILDARQLSGATVGLPRGYVGMKAALLEFAPDAVVVDYPDAAAALTAVARGEVTALLADIVNAAYQVKDLRLTNLRLGSVLPGESDVYMGVRKELGPLPAIVDWAVADITTLERRQMVDRWIGLDFTDHWWLKAFRVAAAIAAIALVVFVLLLLRARRLEAELAARRLLQANLESAHAALARVSEEKTAMMHSVAHDLRNPITVFVLSAEMLELQVDPTNSDVRDTLVGMQRTARQMLAMVDELVDVHMLESGRRKMQWLAVDLVKLSQRTLTDLAELARRKNITMAFEHVTPSMPLSSDEGALRNVLDNLVSNAIKYSPVGSRVLVDLQSDVDGYRLRVVDQGPGIKPEERESIFEKYGLGSAQATGGEKSTGLGLWIVKRTAQDLHGKVWCESGPGSVGSAFVVRLPLQPPAAVPS